MHTRTHTYTYTHTHIVTHRCLISLREIVDGGETLDLDVRDLVDSRVHLCNKNVILRLVVLT